MFYDQARITVKAGDGGAGAMHMRREKFVPRGGPDGGDGGRGGSVYVQANPGLNTLLPFRFKRQYKAQSGGAGSGQRRHGAAGEDLVISVPPGTVVRVAGAANVLADVVQEGQRVLVARGGKGGLGNVHFATSTERTPEFAQKGEPGEGLELELELRVIADVGLVGYPNAGKSSLLAAISAARPRIADYPFTTLEPNLGVVGVADDSFVVADIPGLIEGAHAGAGLGLQFLRHVERTRLLVHVLDAAALEGRDPLQDFERINAELAQYSATLAERPQIVAANKMDLPDARTHWPQLRAAFEARGIPAYPISAATREGIEPLLRAVVGRLAELRQEEAERAAAPPAAMEVTPDHRTFTPLAETHEFDVRRVGRQTFEVSGRAAARAAAMTDVSNQAGVNYLQQRLRQLGITSALEKAGIRAGNIVRIGETEFRWKTPTVTPPKPRRTARQRKLG